MGAENIEEVSMANRLLAEIILTFWCLCKNPSLNKNKANKINDVRQYF